MEKDDKEFRVLLRREPGYQARLTVRFEIHEGHGVLHLNQAGRKDRAPTAISQEPGIDPEALRLGRFTHIVQGGRRRSYALSRLVLGDLQKLPDDRFVELDAITDHGFRYLMVPAAALLSGSGGAAAVQLGADGGVATLPPNAVSSAPPTTPARATQPRVAMPPRQSAMSPDLARHVLNSLTRDQLVQRLTAEMEKVANLFVALDQSKTGLKESQARERDLLDVLSKWQQRAGPDEPESV